MFERITKIEIEKVGTRTFKTDRDIIGPARGY
jgi:hypothetical protein